MIGRPRHWSPPIKRPQELSSPQGVLLRESDKTTGASHYLATNPGSAAWVSRIPRQLRDSAAAAAAAG